jgi:hypothetical protein
MVDIQGHLVEVGSSRDFHPLECKKRPDGTYVLIVDTELELDAGNIYISNIKVGSLNQSSSNLRYLKVLDDGTVVTVSNPTQFYRVADTDDPDTGNVSGINYYGFVDVDGAWYIMREDLTGATATYRYTKGSTNYATNWTGRAGLTYDYFFNIF